MAMGWTALRSAFSGYNASIFAYGQTGSGKSFSMIGDEKEPGLVRRVGELLFDFIARGEALEPAFGPASDKSGGPPGKLRFSTEVSACEVYCE